MNDADSKKLEEAKKMSVAIYLELPESVADDVASKVRWLVSKVTEQDGEIERLRVLLRMGWKESAEKAEAELAAQLITYQAKIKRIDELENINRLYAEGAIKGNARVLEAERKVYIYENRLIHVFQDQVWVEKQKE